MDDDRTNGDKPFAPGNIDQNGDYIVGKGRPPEGGKFRKDDGRKRGRRVKGTRNLVTDFADELAQRITVNESGKQRRYTKQRVLVKRTIERAIKGSDRATELSFNQARMREQQDERRAGPAASDQDIVEAFLKRRIEQMLEAKTSSDDPTDGGALEGRDEHA